MKKLNIIYVSKHGHTKRYAMMVAEKLGVNLYTPKEAKKQILKNEPIIFMTHLFNARLQEYKKINKKYNIQAICAVGMSFYRDTLIELIKVVNELDEDFPIFYAQGGLNPKELSKIEIFGVQMSLGSYNNIKEPTEEDYKTVDMLSNPADYVSEENLNDFLEFLLEQENSNSN